MEFNDPAFKNADGAMTRTNIGTLTHSGHHGGTAQIADDIVYSARSQGRQSEP